jgi:hypothetical protein
MRQRLIPNRKSIAYICMCKHLMPRPRDSMNDTVLLKSAFTKTTTKKSSLTTRGYSRSERRRQKPSRFVVHLLLARYEIHYYPGLINELDGSTLGCSNVHIICIDYMRRKYISLSRPYVSVRTGAEGSSVPSCEGQTMATTHRLCRNL